MTNFAAGLYKSDRLKYLNPHTVEFTTPANSKGLGTDSRLLANTSPITGVSLLTGADTDLIVLSLRFSAEAPRLASAMIRQVEREYAEAPPDHP